MKTETSQAGRALRPFESAIQRVREDFSNVANGLEYDQEKIFALQGLMRNEYAMQVANANPLSVRLAMLNLAATGLTLNPAFGYAYLVPRDGGILLDISYRGLLKIATDSGAIAWARAECVYQADSFEYMGPAAMPKHKTNPFVARGEIVGAYCIAKTSTGDVLTDVMDREELEKIRAKSDLFARKKSGPWVEWFSEMCCKAVIKRAHKTWPQSDRMSRLVNAIDLANSAEGGYTLNAEPVVTVTPEQAASIRDFLDASGIPAPQFLALFQVETIEALPANRYAEIMAILQAKAGSHANN